MNKETLNSGLFSFLKDSPSPFHAVKSMEKILLSNGFQRLEERSQWQLDRQKPYFTTREDGTLVAFNIGDTKKNGFRIIGSHSDSPCLKVKPQPDLKDKNYHRLGVEVYGGALLNPWFDRDLSFAGRVSFNDTKGAIHTELIDFERACAVIPSLAIHLDRQANKERSINPQKDLVPLIGYDFKDGVNFNSLLIDQLNRTSRNADIEEVIGYDIFAYDCAPPQFVGMNEEFITGSRLDNLLSCYIAAITTAHADRSNSFMFICNNHEEVGSESSVGAESNIAPAIFERVFDNKEKFYQEMAESFFISIDNAHAVHPNFPEKHDANHEIALNEGVVIKLNGNQRYTSNALSTAIFKNICKIANTPYQEFVMRSDMACGSTIGPIISAKLGLQSVDIGAASLAMHSIRELTGSKDPYYLFEAVNGFLNCETIPGINSRA